MISKKPRPSSTFTPCPYVKLDEDGPTSPTRSNPIQTIYENSVIHDGKSPEAARVTGYPGGHVEGYPDTFRALFSQVYADVVAGGPAAEPAYPSFVDGLDALLVTEAIARSSREQRWVTVDRR